MKALLWVVPRVHQNMSGWLDVCDRLGLCQYAVISQKFQNERSEPERIVMRPSCAAELLASFWRRSAPDIPASGILSSFRQAFLIFQKTKPAAVIIRNPQWPYAWPYLLLGMIRCRVILYTQGPKLRETRPWARRNIVKALEIVGVKWITPVCRETPVATWDTGMHFVPFAIPVDVSTECDGTDGVTVLCVAKCVPRKNLLTVIDGAAAVARLHPQIKLVLALQILSGEHEAHFHEIRTRASSYDHLRIEFRVNVGADQMVSLYASASIFVLLSRNEPASISQLEAMSHGCVPIITCQSGTASYVENGVSGFVVNPNLEELKSALGRLMENKLERERMAREARARARSLSPENSTARFGRLLDL